MSRVRRLYAVANQATAPEPSIEELRVLGTPVPGMPGVYRLHGHEYYSADLLSVQLPPQRPGTLRVVVPRG